MPLARWDAPPTPTTPSVSSSRRGGAGYGAHGGAGYGAHGGGGGGGGDDDGIPTQSLSLSYRAGRAGGIPGGGGGGGRGRGAEHDELLSPISPMAGGGGGGGRSFAYDTPAASVRATPARRGRSGGGYAGGYAGGGGGGAGRAVTVFGFPPEKASAVVQRFQKFGEVLLRRDGGDNFVHILYKQPVMAEAALAQNGKVIDGVMIGVLPAREDDLHAGDERRDESFASAYDASYRRRPRRISSRATRDIEAKPAGRASSLCSKIVQYIFNW